MFVKMDRHQSRLFASAYGAEHLTERLNAVGRLSGIHEEWAEFFTVSFLNEMWEMMGYQYGIGVSEGAHYILGRYDEGVTLAKIRMYAFATNGGWSTAWKFTPTFDFDDEDGSGKARSCRK